MLQEQAQVLKLKQTELQDLESNLNKEKKAAVGIEGLSSILSTLTKEILRDSTPFSDSCPPGNFWWRGAAHRHQVLTKLSKIGPQIFQDLSTVYGENALKQPTVFKWMKRFREGRAWRW